MDNLGRKVMEMAEKTAKPINVASVPHRSVFRYPGGKTWLVPHLRRWLASLETKPAEFVEPFAGGGICGLTAIFENLSDSLTLVELDESISSVWQVILNGKGKSLAERIVSFDVTLENVRAVLDAENKSLLDKAFAAIVRNRMQRGGIMAPGASLMKSGEAGKGLKSRWYSETLKKRILDIIERKKSITFIKGDGIAYLQSIAKRQDVACLVDPPYTVAGRRLYAHSEIDHDLLFRVVAKSKFQFLMTYDNCEAVHVLAEKYGLDTQEVAMKNTHHAVMSELLIGRDLSWSR